MNKNFHNVKLGNFKYISFDFLLFLLIFDLEKLNILIFFLKFFKLRTSNEGLKLGDLSGNRFKIVLRELSEKNDLTISKSIESLKNNGFLNYFGLQRFGNNIEVPTHIIGKQVNFYLFIYFLKNILVLLIFRFLITNKIKEAIEYILKPRVQNWEKEEITRAREIWSATNDPNLALAHIQRLNCIEKFLLDGIAKSSKNDFLGAFQHVIFF